MVAAAQLKLGQSVMRRLANCTAVFSGGSIPGIVSNLPIEAIASDTRVQARDISLRLLATDASGLNLAEDTEVDVQTDLPQAGQYKLLTDPVAMPNVGHVVVALRKTR